MVSASYIRNIKYQSLSLPLRTSHIDQCQAVITPPPFSPLSVKSCVLNRACCWGWQTRAGGEKRQRKGGNEKRENELYSRESSEARQIHWRNPPSSQMNIAASLPPPPSPPLVSIAVFSPPPFLASSPLFISVLRVPSSRLQLLLLLQPVYRARWISPWPGYAAEFSSHLSLRAQAWRHRAGPFLPRGRVSRQRVDLTAAEEQKRKQRGFLSFLALKEFCLSGSISSVGLQFWLCIGTRKRGPKCLKPITCCLCLGVTLRCVALIYVACWDTALIPKPVCGDAVVYYAISK